MHYYFTLTTYIIYYYRIQILSNHKIFRDALFDVWIGLYSFLINCSTNSLIFYCGMKIFLMMLKYIKL
ncbi:hypothetical protein HZS_6564 [Henneguya salminicola]|nr:hypothetical protein HZS_6564 [Henneguya salminicola]